MVAISKLYHPPLNRVTCSQIMLHKGCSCTDMLLWNCYRCMLSSAKYFLPLAISPLALKLHKLKRQNVLDTLKHYVETFAWAGLCSSLTFYVICNIRKTCGKFYKYTATLIPAYIVFQLAWLFPARSIKLFSIGTSQAALETLICHLDNPLTATLINSKLLQTVLFMFGSAAILHFKRNKSYDGFWFLQPTALPLSNSTEAKNTADASTLSTNTSTKTNCTTHNNISCSAFVLHGMRTMLLYGLPLDLLNVLMKGRKPKNLRELGAKLKMLRFNMTAFFLSYMGLYRASICVLAHAFKDQSSELQHLFSAFLSGISYIFIDKLTFCILSLVLAVQASWQNFCKNSENESNARTFKAFLKQIPLANIIIPINLAYLVHAFIFHNYTVSKLARGFLIGVTDNRIQQIYDHVINVDVETLLRNF